MNTFIRKIGDTSKVFLFTLIDATDNKSGLPGATVTVERSKNGGASAALSGSVSEVDAADHPGVYAISPASGDVDTYGSTVYTYSAPGGVTNQIFVEIVAYDPYDADALGLSYLDEAISGILAVDGLTNQEIAQVLAAAAAGIRNGNNIRDLTDTLNRIAFTANRATVNLDHTPTP